MSKEKIEIVPGLYDLKPDPKRNRYVKGWMVRDGFTGTCSKTITYREAQKLVRELRSKELERVQFHRLPSDGNGNPRYVCDHSWFLTNEELADRELPFITKYSMAVNRANQIGGRRYDFRSFRGGIALSSYSLKSELQHMSELTGRRYVDFDR